MKNIDMRFDALQINEWIGKQFNMYKCDSFEFTNSVTQIVGLYIGNKVYALTNIQESVDYFGNVEDIAITRLKQAEDGSIVSAFTDVSMISTPINEKIVSVKLVNENQKITINGIESYNVWLTRAIIISTGEREISFEKDTVPFSEEIIVRRGYDLIDKCSDESGFLDSWDEGYVPECTREVVEITG